VNAGEHRQGFIDFVALETASAGPSPNLHLIAKAAEELPNTRTDRAWFAACYAAIYNTPGALLLFDRFGVGDCEHFPADVEAWLEANKAGIPVHSNRLRTHGSMRKLSEGLAALADFVVADEFERGDDYDRLWAQVHEVKAVGRYFGIKFAGALHRLGLTEARQYDIRARGAKNGRRTLALIFPDDAELLDLKSGGNSKEAVGLAEFHAQQLRLEVHGYGLECDWFQFEALLCEYNQMVKGDRYPGKTSDSDLDALRRVEAHFGVDHLPCLQTWRARSEALPPFALELQKRKPLLDVYKLHGYEWSDALYDYDATDNLAGPVRLKQPFTSWEPLLQPGGQL
jgi:hypothetical protein